MKNWLILLCILPFAATAQECTLKSSTDPFTHETKLSTGFAPYNRGSVNLSISIDATPSIIDFFFWFTGGSYCFDDQSYAEVIFEGEKSKMRLKNTGSMNCQGAFHFSFKNLATTGYQLKKLSTKKVSSINIVGAGKKATFVAFTEEQQESFLQAAACVERESKSLLK